LLVSRKHDQEASAAADNRLATPDVRVHTIAANVGDPVAGEQCITEVLTQFGRLDVLVNNAATNPYFGPTLGVDEARFDKTVQTNVRGPLFWSKAVWNQAMRERPGVIVNVASVGGLRAEPGLGVYNLTKAMLIHLTRQLAGELRPTRVVGVAPGLVRTDFSKQLVDDFGDRLAAELPAGRLGTPQDVANFVVFLASDAASWITGDTYVIDGGSGVRAAV
jgi:NAD(P)-dependent dehydrogenase (short-subunit alcohol dehydrogenase family)